MNAKLRKSAKKGFEKDYFKLTNNAGFGKTWKMWKNIEISNLQQPKHEGIILCQNQVIIQQNIFWKIYQPTRKLKQNEHP